MFYKTLSGRFLLLSILFVMMAEVLIFVPSVANFRISYLQQRLEKAQIASLALLATPDDMVSPELNAELLKNAEVLNIVLRRNAVRELVLSNPIPHPVDATFDLRKVGTLDAIRDALACAFAPKDKILRVIGMPVKGAGNEIEIVLMAEPVRQAMLAYAKNVLLLSLLISAVTGLLLFLALQVLISRPISKVIASMLRFRDAPEDAHNIITPNASITELHQAEVALRELQTGLNASLRQKERLAQLGGAVSKVSHDLRNMLTTTQVLADMLDMSDDPKVKRMSPKLMNSLSRAVNLCERTLAFGKADEPEPELRDLPLKTLVEDVIDNESLQADMEKVQVISTVTGDIVVRVDPEQMFRVFTNLIRNARQAIEGTGRNGVITITARETRDGVEVCLRDTGPGLPEKAQEHLFKPFQGNARQGGTGLGLAIAAELVRGHGGRLELIETSPAGTTFRIFLSSGDK